MKPQNQSTSDIINNFLKYSTIPICKYLNKSSKCERTFWLSVLLFGITSTVVVTVFIYNGWITEPTFVTLEPSSLPITEVEFPGIALCNMNKISKIKAEKLAEEIHKNNLNEPMSVILQTVQLLGSLYDFSIAGFSRFAKYQDILDSYINSTDLTKTLLNLMVPCDEMLFNCSWNSVTYDCKDIFQTRLSDSGFCCMFNYVRASTRPDLYDEHINRPIPTEVKHFEGRNLGNGLSVTINNNLSDYFYTTMATQGILLKAFFPADYPDLSSGSLKEVVIRENSEVFIQLDPNNLKCDNQIRSMPRSLRKCKFFDEENVGFGEYSSSNCYVVCKIKSYLALCNCIPFMFPILSQVDRETIRFCSIIDIPCLNKFQSNHISNKILRYYPNDINLAEQPELQLEYHDSLECNCIPNCNDMDFDVNINEVEFHNVNESYQHSSKIHLFTTSAYTNLFKKTSTITWYEALSNFGGIMSLFLGISMITIVEMLFVCVKITWVNLKMC
ncbi:pickpocket protein 28-like isoform X1 [Rhynchophorus ferrugineus]|uniref:pickpocket protein 28-like isoform X1 n=1 Tax=Rhynchophorus ferrugineus TaxID=354439 RepID=UPI003FCC56A6